MRSHYDDFPLLISIGSTTIKKLWNILIFHLFILKIRELPYWVVVKLEITIVDSQFKLCT